VRYGVIEADRDRWPVRLMCQVLGVAPGGYYGWRGRPVCPGAWRREALADALTAVHDAVKARYGSPRIHAAGVARGESCCVNTVAKLRREHGSAATTKPKFGCTTDSNHGPPVAENVVDRHFQPQAAHEVGTADSTDIPTREGWLYLAAVEDLDSRPLVAWSRGEPIDSRLVVDALERAVARRLPGAGLVAHSDRGSQYASAHYQRLRAGHAIECSRSRRGNGWDHAAMESFCATLQKELVHDEDDATRKEARASRFEYIEVFDNRVRRHSSLRDRSPVEFEQAG
jgi:transposase InsO family protein